MCKARKAFNNAENNSTSKTDTAFPCSLWVEICQYILEYMAVYNAKEGSEDSTYINLWRESAKRTVSPQWCSVTGEKRKRAQTGTQGSPSEQEQTSPHCEGEQAWTQPAQSPCLEIFKSHLATATALGSQLCGPLLEQQCWIRRPQKVPPNLNPFSASI